jgi:pimeloyl-ACP methyl ester carboxylesterase
MTLDAATVLAGEQRVAANGIELAYQTFGDRSGVPLVMVMGLGTQMIGWPEDLCNDLAERGYFVVRFDNRDIGLSTKLDHLPAPSFAQMRGFATRRKAPPYSFDDMADDTFGLIDALDLGRVHLVGVSMGGFISQTAAIRHPERIRSLTLIMTSTGSRRVGQPKPGILWRMTQAKQPTTPEEAIESTLDTYKVIGSPGFPFDDEYLRAKTIISFEREARDEGGYLRQLAASVGQPNRTAALRTLRLPALVMHGLSDPLVRPSGGIALAKAIPGAKFVGYHGMGHDLPRPLWPDMAAQIASVAARADAELTPEPSVTA